MSAVQSRPRRSTRFHLHNNTLSDRQQLSYNREQKYESNRPSENSVRLVPSECCSIAWRSSCLGPVYLTVYFRNLCGGIDGAVSARVAFQQTVPKAFT